MDGDLSQIERIRQWRGRGRAASPIAREIEHLRRRVERDGKRLAAFLGVWEELFPQALLRQTRITGMRAGVVHVVVESSAARFEIDRRLREGGLAQIRGRAGGSITRVKVSIGSLHDPAMQSRTVERDTEFGPWTS